MRRSSGLSTDRSPSSHQRRSRPIPRRIHESLKSFRQIIYRRRADGCASQDSAGFHRLGLGLGRWSPFGEGIASFSVIRGGYPTVGCAYLLDADGVEVD